MNHKQTSVWVSFGFSIALSAIAMVGNIAGRFSGGGMDVAMPAFLSFLPMCFYFVAVALRDSQQQIEILEMRIKQLEMDKISASV